MTGVGDNSTCPLCGGETSTYFETKTSESDVNCGRCGYAEYVEIEKWAGKLFWVRTEYRPVTHDGLVLGSTRIPTWNPRKFAKPDNCSCYRCQREDKVEPAAQRKATEAFEQLMADYGCEKADEAERAE
jgi:hypothetical protein